jgi:hypothetical protein
VHSVGSVVVLTTEMYRQEKLTTKKILNRFLKTKWTSGTHTGTGTKTSNIFSSKMRCWTLGAQFACPTELGAQSGIVVMAWQADKTKDAFGTIDMQ